MTDYFIEQQIGILPQFQQLTPEQRGQIADITQMVRLRPGELIFRQNDPSRGMYYLVEGSAQLVRVEPGGQPQQIGVVGANQYINEASMSRPVQESAALRALENTLVLLIPRDGLAALLTQRPDIARRLPFRVEGASQPQPQPQQPQQPPPGPQQGRPPQPPPDPRQAGVRPPRGQQPPPGPQQPEQPGSSGQQPPPGQQPPTTSRIEPSTRRDEHEDAPEKVFRSQRDDETLLLDTRRHWWAILVRMWVPALVLVPFIALSFAELPFGLTFALDGVGFIIAGLITLYYYLEWRNDHLIVTDQRVLHIERTILTLEVSISEVPLVSVQEINAELITANPFSRVLDFGTIELKTAGTAGNIEFTRIPHPDRVQEIIFENRERQRYRVDLEHEEEIREDVLRAIGRNPTPEMRDGNDDDDAPKRINQKTSILGWMKSFNDQGETVYRKHLLIWMRRVFVPGLLTMGGVFLLLLGTVTALGVVGLGLGMVVMLVGLIWFYLADWDWRHDTYVIGDDTIKIIHKRPLWLQNENDQVRVVRIDNVVSEQSGLIENLFNYGDVRISLLGGDVGNAKIFKYVPSPQDVQAEITRRMERLRQREQEREQEQRREEYREMLSVYHREVSGGQEPQYGTNPTQGPVNRPPGWNR